MIINLTEMDDTDAKRLVDFAAGLVFGLHGSIERVTQKVFLLSPAERRCHGGGQGPHRRGRVLQPELRRSRIKVRKQGRGKRGS